MSDINQMGRIVQEFCFQLQKLFIYVCVCVCVCVGVCVLDDRSDVLLGV